MNEQKQRTPEERLEALAGERQRWICFLRRRVQSEAEAEDILQEGLVRSMQRVGQVRREEDLFAWFYRVLSHGVVDTHRKRAAAARRDERLAVELSTSAEADCRSAQSSPVLCGCLRARLALLNPRYGRVLEAVDLEGAPAGEVAAAEGVTMNALNVTLHRARQALRRELIRFCGACAARRVWTAPATLPRRKLLGTKRLHIRCKKPGGWCVSMGSNETHERPILQLA